MTFKAISRKVYLQYYRYKDSPYFSLSIYLTVLLFSTILFFSVIIPQATNWFSVQKEIEATRARIAIMNNNIAYLQSINQSSLDRDFKTATTAFPPERDVSSLITAINASAINAGVSLNDFSFQGGEISSRSTQTTVEEQGETSRVTFTAGGSLGQITDMLRELQEKIPLLAIHAVDAQFEVVNRAQITIVYYYQAFPLITEQQDTKIQDITPENRNLLERLGKWSVPQPDFSGFTPSSESADPF